MKLATATQMREIDRRAIHERGIAGIDLMRRAGSAIAGAVLDYSPEASDVAIVLCGPGNNGGDGYVVARMLHVAGRAVRVMAPLGEPAGGDARRALDEYRAAGGPAPAPWSPEVLGEWLGEADVVVDALLGTGARAPLREPLGSIVERVNASQVPVVAADIPTGLDADAGAGDPVMRAACTVTIGLPKVGMLSPAGRRACGVVRVEPIQFPRDLLEDAAIRRETLLEADVARLLPPRPADGHKGTFGTVTICAGSVHLRGAALLSGEGALRSGAGLVRLHVPGCLRDAVTLALPEAIASPWARGDGALQALPAGDASALLAASDAILAGPGIGTAPATEAFLQGLLEARAATRGQRVPLVLDADALNLLATRLDWAALLDPAVVLTPHPGEAARLLGAGTAEVQSDRWGAADQLAARLGATVVLKGWGTLVASPGGSTAHIPAGNSALSRGGSGDVLAGLLGGLAACGLPGEGAARLACFVHGLAADLAVARDSARGLRLGDVMAHIPRAFRQLETSSVPHGHR